MVKIVTRTVWKDARGRFVKSGTEGAKPFQVHVRYATIERPRDARGRFVPFPKPPKVPKVKPPKKPKVKPPKKPKVKPPKVKPPKAKPPKAKPPKKPKVKPPKVKPPKAKPPKAPKKEAKTKSSPPEDMEPEESAKYKTPPKVIEKVPSKGFLRAERVEWWEPPKRHARYIHYITLKIGISDTWPPYDYPEFLYGSDTLYPEWDELKKFSIKAMNEHLDSVGVAGYNGWLEGIYIDRTYDTKERIVYYRTDVPVDCIRVADDEGRDAVVQWSPLYFPKRKKR